MKSTRTTQELFVRAATSNEFSFSLVKFVPVFLGVSISNCVIATFFGIIPATLICRFVGDDAGIMLERGQDLDLSINCEPCLIFPIVGLAVLALVLVVHKILRAHAR